MWLDSKPSAPNFQGSIWIAFQTKANVRLDSEKEKRVLPYRGEMLDFLWCLYFSCHFTPTLRLQSVDHSPAAGHLTCPLHSFPKITLTHSRGSGKGGKGAERRNGKGKGGWEKDHGGKGNVLEKEECPTGSATRV